MRKNKAKNKKDKKERNHRQTSVKEKDSIQLKKNEQRGCRDQNRRSKTSQEEKRMDLLIPVCRSFT